MTMLPPATAEDVRRDLAVAIPRLTTDPSGHAQGVAHFGAGLVGPPGRLHGGLHAYLRLLAVWEALHGALPEQVHLDLDLLAPLRLGTPSPFSVTATQDTLQTVFLDSQRLRGQATRSTEAPHPWVQRFTRLSAQDPFELELPAAGTVPVRLGRALATMRAPTPRAIDHGNTLDRFLAPGTETADAVWMLTALDLLAAVVQGVEWHSHVFTVRMALTVRPGPISGPVQLLADRGTVLDTHVGLPPHDGRRARAVSVLLAGPTLDHAVAWGTISLYPSRHRLV